MELKSRFSLDLKNEGSDIVDAHSNIKTFIELYGYLKTIAVSEFILDETLLIICRIDLLKIVLPIIKDQAFKTLLRENPAKLLSNANQLGLNNIFEGIYNEISLNEHLEHEKLENKIDQEVFNTNRKKQISDVAEENAGKIKEKSGRYIYVSESMRLSKTLLLTKRLLNTQEQVAVAKLKKIVFYDTLVNVGMLISDQFITNDKKARILDGQLSIAYGLYSFMGEISHYYNKLSSDLIEEYLVDNIEDLDAEIEIYGRIAIRESFFYENPALSMNNQVLDTRSYILDEKNLQVTFKIDGKEFPVTKGEVDAKFYLEGAIEINSLIQSSESVKGLYDYLGKVFDKKELLENKKYIEDIADIGISDQEYQPSTNKIKRGFLEKGMKKDAFDRLEYKISDISKACFEQYIERISTNLKKEKIDFDQHKFDSAKASAHKYGKFFSLMAIYDLFDSVRDIKDTATLGRHDNNDLKTIFGINGILDSMNDVRNSIDISNNSKIGKIVNRVPSSVRQSFIMIIDNPIVSSITFATISYQFGYSMNEIIKGNHHPLNYYWASSSGIKMASMSMKPVSIGVTLTIKSVSVSTKVLRVLSAVSKVLSKATIVTTVADLAVTIGVEAYESMKYTEAIARQVPLLDHEAREVFFKGIIKFFTGRNVEKEYKDLIKIKNYLNYNKQIALKILNDSRVAAVVQFPYSFQESYRELIKEKRPAIPPCNQSGPPACVSTTCVGEKDDASLNSTVYYYQEANLSSLNISNALHMKPYMLRSELLESFDCGLHIGFKLYPFSALDFFDCPSKNGTQVFILSESEKHLPHLTIQEYGSGLRYLDAPLGRPGQVGKSPQCIVINKLDNRLCDVNKVYSDCQENFTLSGVPLIFANNSNLNSGKDRRSTSTGGIVYLPGPKNVTAATDYLAEMYVTGGTGVYFIGSEKRGTTFFVNEHLEGTLKGGIGKENTVVMNLQFNIANLTEGIIRLGDNSTAISFIKLVNTYNYISNFVPSSDSKQIIVTHCNTRFVSAMNAEISQGFLKCQDKDYETIVVGLKSKCKRGPKQAIFLVNKRSISSEIVGDFNETGTIKRNVDIVEIIDANIKQLKITEDNKENTYILNLLDNNAQSVVSSVKIDSFENLVVKGKYSDLVDAYVTMQDKSLLSSLTKGKNSNQGLSATIQAKIPNLVSNDAYQVAKDIADNNNLDLPIHRIEVVQEGKPGKKAIISKHSDQIAVDFNCVSQSTGAYSYCQNVDVKGGNRYVISLPKLLEHGSSPEISRFYLNIKRRDFVFSNSISFTMFDSIDVKSMNMTVDDTDSLVIEMTTDKGILSVNLCNYFRSQEQYIVLQMNNKFYGINDVDLELKQLEKVNSDFIRYSVPEENGLQVYHNQPVNKNDIGLVDLKGKSILDCNIEVTNNSLLLLHNNNTIVKVENWGTYQPARKMMFAFSDTVVFDRKCMVFVCNPENIMTEFYTIKNSLEEYNLFLFDAATDGKFSKVEDFIARGADVNAKDQERKTPLHLAAIKGHSDIIEKLIEKNASVNAVDEEGKTPLHYAAIKGHSDIIEKLIEKNASVNAVDEKGKAPLHYAAENGRLAIVEKLIEKRADINAKDYKGKTPLHLAAAGNCLTVVKKLIEKGAYFDIQDTDGKKPLDLTRKGSDVYLYLSSIEELFNVAKGDSTKEVEQSTTKEASINTKNNMGKISLHGDAGEVHSDMIACLIERGVVVNVMDKKRKTPLHFAAEKGYLDVVEELIRRGANVNAGSWGQTPLHLAAAGDHLDVVKKLIEKGAYFDIQDTDGKKLLDLTRKGSDVYLYLSSIDELFNLAKVDSIKKVEQSIARGASVNAKNNRGETPLHLAAKEVYPGVVEKLIEKGANINAEDNSNRTPLHLAAIKGHSDIIEKLIEKNANIHAMDEGGKTALHFAVMYDQSNVVRKLIEKRANVNAKDQERKTPLHLAAIKGHSDIIEKLIEKNASVNAVDEEGKTPLHYAAINGHSDIIEKLIEKNASVNAVDEKGKTPLHYAAINGRPDVIAKLIEKGGSVSITDKEGKTPLHFVSTRSFPPDRTAKSVVEEFMKKGADVNARDNLGETPLYLAAKGDNLAIVKELVEKGANIDDYGETPLDVARDKGHSRVVNYLEEELNKGRGEPAQHKRRHHHGDHNSHHLSRKPRAIDSSNQIEIVASSGTIPSSWINGLLGWVKSSVGGLISSVTDKFSTKELENSKSGDTDVCSAGLEKVYSAIIPQSRKSLGVPKGNIPHRSGSSNREKVRSNVTVVPEISTTVVNNVLILGDLAVRFMNGTSYQQPIHENLLSPREQSMRSMDEDMIIRAIQQGKEKFGVPSTNMDEVEIIGNKTKIGK